MEEFSDPDPLLTALAQQKNRRVTRWLGRRNTTSRRTYWCYLCDTEIDTESSRYGPTKHAALAIADHRDAHLAQLPPLWRDAAYLASLSEAAVIAWIDTLEG